jgi:hypothetical protein
VESTSTRTCPLVLDRISHWLLPKQVKCYELNQLAIKFERHMDSEIVDFQIIEEDYSKMVFLCADRSVNFHAKFGFHHKIRTPRWVGAPKGSWLSGRGGVAHSQLEVPRGGIAIH